MDPSLLPHLCALAIEGMENGRVRGISWKANEGGGGN